MPKFKKEPDAQEQGEENATPDAPEQGITTIEKEVVISKRGSTTTSKATRKGLEDGIELQKELNEPIGLLNKKFEVVGNIIMDNEQLEKGKVFKSPLNKKLQALVDLGELKII